jgi:MFS family permease
MLCFKIRYVISFVPGPETYSKQWAGINVIVFYAPTVLEQNVGLPRQTSLIASGFILLSYALAALIPSFGLDKIGRKPLLVIGGFGMGIAMMLIGILLSFKGTPQEAATSKAAIGCLVLVMPPGLIFGLYNN